MNQSVSRAVIVKRASKMKKPKPKFAFGKYKGKTLDWVEENHPEYVVWVRNNVSKSYWPVGLAEAYDRCYYRATDDVDDSEYSPFSEDFAIFHE